MRDGSAFEGNSSGDEGGRSGGARESHQRFDIRFPAQGDTVDQDQEWCEVGVNGTARTVRFHDYAAIYSMPGLYEQLFYEELDCRSPQTVCALLGEELRRAGIDARGLTVFDLGAGNGMVGEELARLSPGSIVGVDILPEAAAAAHRDRPGLYDDYLVLDLTAMLDDTRRTLQAQRFNCLTSVAALGFGDIPPRAFAEAYNLVLDGAWIAFTIKEDFLAEADGTGFSRLIRRMLADGAIELRGERRYRHRLSMAGEPLHYVALIALKRRDVAIAWTDDLRA